MTVGSAIRAASWWQQGPSFLDHCSHYHHRHRHHHPAPLLTPPPPPLQQLPSQLSCTQTISRRFNLKNQFSLSIPHAVTHLLSPSSSSTRARFSFFPTFSCRKRLLPLVIRATTVMLPLQRVFDRFKTRFAMFQTDFEIETPPL